MKQTTDTQSSIAILVNGEPIQVLEGSTLQQLIDTMDLQGKRFAVERNQEIVPKSIHKDVVLAADDVLEIVHAIGGG
ncbi:MAG: sulfur carrier protein ThiS [Pseudomonadales bacterium]|nr:sulfur carrier protein ThiS [Pseudomonadales bacterium]